MLPEGGKRGLELLPCGRSSLKRKSMGEPWIRRNKQTRDLLYAEGSAKVGGRQQTEFAAPRKAVGPAGKGFVRKWDNSEVIPSELQLAQESCSKVWHRENIPLWVVLIV